MGEVGEGSSILERLKAIVLRTVKYGDTGLVVDCFTAEHGRVSFITGVGGGRKRGSSGMALWRPMNLVEFSAELGSSKGMPRLHNASVYASYFDIPFNHVKSAQTMFLAECLIHVLHESSSDNTLYNYIETSLLWLDAANEGYANFHIYFLLRLTRFVGIEPNMEQRDADAWRVRGGANLYFDMQAGSFCYSQPVHPHFIAPAEAVFLPLLMRMSLRTMHLYGFSRNERQRILSAFNTYYRLHIPSFPQLRSLEVLREVFD